MLAALGADDGQDDEARTLARSPRRKCRLANGQIRMCGIFGWVAPGGSDLSRADLEAFTNSLSHRGPDGSGIWRGQTRDGDFEIALGHRRLSVIDLSDAGSQPMLDAQGRVLIFNGEIYNYLELRDDLGRLGVQFSSASDTEVLQAALSSWGMGALQKLRGMFAFACYDPTRETLLLARDPFGKKPLYIAPLSRGGLVFGSEMQAVSRFPGVSRDVDQQSVSEYIQYRYVPGPNTLLSSVKKLPPGNHINWRRGRHEQVRYYVPPLARRKAENWSLNDAAAAVRPVLKRAVEIRLRSDAPFGLFLSGGLDSSVVLQLMSEILRDPVSTFSIGFEEGKYSELPSARLAAEAFRSRHHEVLVGPGDFEANLSKAVLHRGAPVSEASDIPIMMLAREASKSVKMVLTGEGADELFGGYPKHAAELWSGAYFRSMPEALHERLVRPMLGAMPRHARSLQIAARALSDRSFESRMAAWLGMSNSDAKGLLTVPTAGSMRDPFPLSGGDTPLRRCLFFDQASWLPDNLLERGDRMMMAHGVEGRMPFMDQDLAELASTFPDRLLVSGIRGKHVLRKAFQGSIPEAILKRPKNGFRVPMGDWFRGPLRSFLADYILAPSARSASFLDRKAVAELFDQHVSGRKDHDKILWTLLNLEQFLQVYDVSA